MPSAHSPLMQKQDKMRYLNESITEWSQLFFCLMFGHLDVKHVDRMSLSLFKFSKWLILP